jgi:pimeloyl-ACP methyl ester carboxylesterase
MINCLSRFGRLRPKGGIGMAGVDSVEVDYLEAGSIGPAVVLVHSSVAGARQWRRLMDDLQGDFRVRAVNLFGYGNTPAWTADRVQSLDDQARLVAAAVPADAGEVYLVGHSFGGAVAMKAAARLAGRVSKLVLLEANPFDLLIQSGRVEAYAEIAALRDCIKKFGALGEWTPPAQMFADYWSGEGGWGRMSEERRAAFQEGLRPNFHEWDAVMGDTTSLDEWARLLPQNTLAIMDRNTVVPIREINELLRTACPDWTFREVDAGGHMAPLTRPEVVNPLVRSFLLAPA